MGSAGAGGLLTFRGSFFLIYELFTGTLEVKLFPDDNPGILASVPCGLKDNLIFVFFWFGERKLFFLKNSFDIVYQMFISFTFVYSNLGVCFASFHWGWLLQATLFHTFKRLCCVWWLVPMVSPWIWKQLCCVPWTQRLSCVRRCRCGALLRWNAPGRSGNCYQKWLDSTWWHFETSSDMWHLWILPYNAY